MNYSDVIEKMLSTFKEFGIENFKFNSKNGKLTVKFEVPLTERPKKQLKVATPDPAIKAEQDIKKTTKDEPHKADIADPLNPANPITHGKPAEVEPEPKKVEATISDVPSIVPETEKKDKDNKEFSLSTNKTLYGDHIFSEDEEYMIKCYLKREVKPLQAAELLNITTKDFNALVRKWQRTRNLEDKTTTKEKTATPRRKASKYDGIDLDYVYNLCKRGDTLTAVAKDLGIPQCTLSSKLRKYMKENNLEYIFKNHSGGRVAGSSLQKKAKSDKDPSLNKKIENESVLFPGTPSPIAPKKVIVQKVEVPAGTPDGWQMLPDGKFHNIKNGVLID